MTAIGPFKSLTVTDFGTDRKPVCHILLVNKYLMSYHFRFIVAYWLNYHFWQGVPLFNSLVQCESLKCGSEI